MKYVCAYSSREVMLPTKWPLKQPVECPDCGAIRKLVKMPFAQGLDFTFVYIFPEHHKIIRVPKIRKRWKWMQNNWHITEV